MTHRTRFSASALIAVAGLALPALAQQPQGGQVAGGQATINQNGNYTGITAGNGAIINWQSFNIGQGQTVQFFQPGANARVLNRITGPDPSQIAGTLLANGIVYIVNPAGVFFTQGAVINVGGIYAAAGNISNVDFLAGRNHFTGVQGTVRNDGTINSPAAHLVGQRVANYGTINAPNGMVTMTAGSDVFLGEQGGQVFARVEGAPANGGTGVMQAGDINATGGQVRLGAGDMYAVAIDHPGRTTARNITLQGGRGGPDQNVQGGIVSVSGTLDAADRAAGHTGGTVKVLGDRVGIMGSALIDVSGDAGGGTALVGGNQQGVGPETNSRATYVGQDATIRADATGAGDGGRVIVWSDHLTRAYGNLSARGGSLGGNGGLVETSGRHELQVSKTPDITSPRGSAGRWLIDPDDLTFASGNGSVNIVTSGSTIFTSNGAGATLGVDLVTAALNGGAVVDIVTGNSGNPTQGTITLPAGVVIDYNGTGTNTLRLFAHRDIVLDGQILDSNTGSVDVLNLSLTADSDMNGTGDIAIHNSILTGGGDFAVVRAIDFDNTGGSITTGGGDVTISLASTAGRVTLGADINAGSGTVLLNPDVVLGADITVTGGNVTFARRIDSDGTARALDVDLTGAGTTRFFGRIGFGSALSSLDVSSAGNAGTTRLAATSIDATGAVSFFDDVELVADTDISASSVTFARTIDSWGGARDLDITLTGSGLARFFGVIGGAEALGTLSVDSATHLGTTRMGAGAVTTLGAQSYGQDVVLLGDTVMTGAGLTFARKVDSDGTPGGRDLTLNTTGGTDTRFFGLVGSGSALGQLTTNADGTTILNTTGVTAADVHFGDEFRLGADATIAGTATVVFDGLVNSRSGQVHDLFVNSPDTTFNGAVGGLGAAIRTLRTDAAGTTRLNGDRVGAQFVDFGDAVVLGDDVVIQSDGSVVFRSTLNSVAAGHHDLSVTAPVANFNGRVGTAGADTGLGVLSVDGGVSTLNAARMKADTFNFDSAVILAFDLTLDAAVRARFGAELDSRSGQSRDLTINSPDTVFDGVVGGASGGRLGTLATDAAGTTTLAGGALSAGSAVFDDAVLIGTDVVLGVTSSVAFNSTVNSVTGLGNDLTVNALDTRFQGAVGGIAGGELGILTTDGAGTTRVNAAVSARSFNFLDAVVLDSDVTVTASNSALFGSTINSAAGEGNDLIVNALSTRFDGAIGGGTGAELGLLSTDSAGTTTAGGAITAATVAFGDDVSFAGGTITTTGDQTFGGTLKLDADTILAGHNITFEISVDSGIVDRSLAINTTGGGETVFNGPVGSVNPLASLITNADGTTVLAGGVINTSGDQTYNDPVILGLTTVIGANDITFAQTINSDSVARSLSLNSTDGGITILEEAIGGTSALSALITNADGSTRLNGGTVMADGSVAFNDDVLLGADTTITGSGVAFEGELNSDFALRSLDVITVGGGVTSFGGTVGNTSALSSITTNADGLTQIFGGSIRTTGNQTYNDAVVLGEDCLMNGEDVTFGSTLDSTDLLDSAGLTVNSVNDGETTFMGDVGSSSALKFLTTDATGTTRIGGDITTNGTGMSFLDTVRLMADVTLTDSGGTGVNFGGTLDSEGSARALSIMLNTGSNASVATPTIAHVSFGGNVGSAFALSSLSIGGDRAVPASAATILAGVNAGTVTPNYSLTITTNGAFSMGLGQKFAVLGDLTINAGSAVLGDISTLRNMTVNAPSIAINSRPGGVNLFNAPGGSSGVLRAGVDNGVDFVAGGAINFSTTPTVLGGSGRPSFATPGTQNISGTLVSFSQRDSGTVTELAMHSGSLVLDLSATGPSNVNISEALAGALPTEAQVGMVFRDTAAGKAQREELAELGISTSDPDAKLLADILTGRAFYNDAAARDPWASGYAVSIDRLSARAVTAVLASYKDVFVKDGQSQAAHVQETLEAAWREYSVAAGSKADPLGFRAYVEAVPAQAQALYYMDGLRDLFTQLGYLGLSPAELRHTKATILRVVAVPGLSAAQLESAIMARNLGVMAAR